MEVFKQIEGQSMKEESKLTDIQMENSKYKQIDLIQLGMISCKQIDQRVGGNQTPINLKIVMRYLNIYPHKDQEGKILSNYRVFNLKRNLINRVHFNKIRSQYTEILD